MEPFSETKEGLYWKNIYWGKSKSVAEFDREKFVEFLDLPPEELKKACCDEEGRLKHIISAEHFDLPFLEKICETAQAARRIARDSGDALKILSGKSILNFFSQPSQRTFLSFSNAETRLGMMTEEVRDIRTSSYTKGESEKDSLRTASSYFDAIVFRHLSDIYDSFAVWVMKHSDREISIINGGSGKGEHPTQGILDYLTKRQSFQGDLDNKIILYVGDCLRGRTVHSSAKIMALHEGTIAYFAAPEELQIDQHTEAYITQRGTTVHKETSTPLRELVEIADVVYMTRLQDEHGGNGEYPQDYKFTLEMLDMMKEDSILMHPMPKREEIDPRIDYLERHPKVMYWRQQRNGLWTRVALLAHVFGVDEQIS